MGEGALGSTEKWRITVPVEGFDFTIRDKFDVQGATVETLRNIKNSEMEPMISLHVDGDRKSAIVKGRAFIDRIAARLSLLTGKEIRLKSEVYLTQLQPETAKEKKGWGYHEYEQTVLTSFTIGDPYVSMARFVRELEDVKQENQDIINKAAAYYREALATANPFQEIITLFSSIQVIAQDVWGDNTGNSIRKVLHDFVNVQKSDYQTYYWDYRSAADHGGKDILDTQKIREAQTKAVEIRKVTFRLIREYANRNKKQ